MLLFPGEGHRPSLEVVFGSARGCWTLKNNYINIPCVALCERWRERKTKIMQLVVA